MTLEIKVQEEINVEDSVVKAIEYVTRRINEWFESDDQEPLVITLTKKDGRAPPTLGISVSEAIETLDKFGGY